MRKYCGAGIATLLSTTLIGRNGGALTVLHKQDESLVQLRPVLTYSPSYFEPLRHTRVACSDLLDATFTSAEAKSFSQPGMADIFN